MSRRLITERVKVKNKEFEYKYLHTKKAVVIVPVLPNEEIVLVKQYRFPVKAHVLELPAGGLESEENPKDAALRELIEETGYQAEEIELLTTFYSSPGITDEVLYLYLAQISTKGAQQLDEIEEIDLHTYKIDDALKLVKDQKITDGKTILGLLWYSNFIR